MVQAKRREWKQKGLRLLFLPPYCPHLNLIEILWRQVKYRWLAPEAYPDFATLCQSVTTFWLRSERNTAFLLHDYLVWNDRVYQHREIETGDNNAARRRSSKTHEFQTIPSPRPGRVPLIYVRAAVHEPGQIAERIDAARALARSQGLLVAEADIIAEAGSGARAEGRPGLQQLLRRIQNGEVSHVVCPAWSHLSRNHGDAVGISQALDEANVTVVTEQGSHSAEPESHSLRILAGVADLGVPGRVFRRERMAASAGHGALASPG